MNQKTFSRVKAHYTTVIFNLLILVLFVGAVSANSGYFFTEVNAFLQKHVREGWVDYRAIKKNPGELHRLLSQIADFDREPLQKKRFGMAFYINAYNLLVIKSVVDAYPVSSPRAVGGFFDRKKHRVAGEMFTLNELENSVLREKYADPRIHFALVCAAKGCPPLPNEAFTPQRLDLQLNQITRRALNDTAFVQVDWQKRTVYLSQIFQWYREDFSQENGGVTDFINRFREEKIPADFPVSYLEYDWQLNNASEKLNPFVFRQPTLQFYTPSTLLSAGQVEVKVFNNLYTQKAFFDDRAEKKRLNTRSSYFTGIANFLYGVSGRWNVGFDLYFRSVRNDRADSSPFSVLKFSGEQNISRTAFTYLGPKVKFSPFSQVASLSVLRKIAVQTMVLIPLAKDPETRNGVFLEYDAPQWWTQFFYDTRLSAKFLIYLESGTYWRFSKNETAFTTPFKAILNYYPSKTTTLYFPTELAPSWSGFSWSSYYFQTGVGGKLQLTPNLELEALFTNFFAGKQSGAGLTYNLGFRFIR